MNTKKAALIIMHCQNDIVHPDGLYRHAGVYAQVEKNHTLDTIASLAQACRDAGIQVIYINNEFKEGYPELGPNNLPICTSSRDTHSFLTGTWGVKNPDVVKPKDQDLVIINVNTSAFSYTNLDQILRAKDIRNLYLAGFATNFVVDSTARYVSELGYNIFVLEDCCESFTEEMHEFEIKNILPKFGTITSSKEMLEEMK